MDDTHKNIKDIFHERVMRLSPEERLKMGCSMYDSAKKIVLASLMEKNPGAVDFRRDILIRFYGSELGDTFK